VIWRDLTATDLNLVPSNIFFFIRTFVLSEQGFGGRSKVPGNGITLARESNADGRRNFQERTTLTPSLDTVCWYKHHRKNF
jgi:hypothetical protein